jgi:predicted DsbA family dithiol-disulfide isomerase
MRVDVWADVICPWCYLGREHLYRAITAYGDEVQVVHHAFELDPYSPRQETSTTTERLAAKYGMSQPEAIAAQEQMAARAADAGLTFNYAGQLSGNTRDAHRLIRLALYRGVQDEMVERLYRGYFTDSRSLFDAGSLTALAAEVDGLDDQEVAATLRSDAFEDEVVADENQAYALGVTGVPFFVVDRRYGMSGAQPPEVLLQVLERAATEVVSP